MKKTFDTWFVAQFGKRPSKQTNYALMHKARNAQHALYKAQGLWDRCIAYEDRKADALLGWNAMRILADSKKVKK